MKSPRALTTKVWLLIILSVINSASSVLFPWLFPRLRCSLAMLQMGFDITQFDRYHEFFNDDSVMQLAQTGEYHGADDIKEYVKFALAMYTPYAVDIDPPIDPQLTVIGINRTSGQCEYLAIYDNKYTFEAETANGTLPKIRVVSMVKLFLDVRKRVITRGNAYYTPDYLRVIFGVGLNSPNTRKFVCKQVIEGPCKDILSATNGTVECENKLNALPAVDGSLYRVDGNTQGCRALHAVFAQTNPTLHCAHLSFEPMQDPKGRNKCQKSGTALPADLFSVNDFKAFDTFASARGIDPAIGHNCSAC